MAVFIKMWIFGRAATKMDVAETLYSISAWLLDYSFYTLDVVLSDLDIVSIP